MFYSWLEAISLSQPIRYVSFNLIFQCERRVRKCIRWYNRIQPLIIGIVSPVWFLLTILGLNGMATDHILDSIYGKYSVMSWITKFLAWFMSFEMLMNWVCLCTVKSTFINSPENNQKRLDYEKTNPHLSSTGVDYDTLKVTSVKELQTNNWSVITHHTEKETKKLAYPYWGWKPCVVCSCYKPPRCHHCPLCDVCVLKRDHHCFFAMQCVGLRNQRFFLVFNFWAVLLVLFAIPQLFYYFFTSVWSTVRWSELFLPWTAFSYLLGWSKKYTLAIIFQMWSLSFFILLSASFLHEQISCIEAGLTSYELENPAHVTIKECKSRRERYACVFGRRFTWLNFIIPMHFISEPTDDGIVWTSVKLE